MGKEVDVGRSESTYLKCMNDEIAAVEVRIEILAVGHLDFIRLCYENEPSYPLASRGMYLTPIEENVCNVKSRKAILLLWCPQQINKITY